MKKGFSLIEILVTIGILSLMIVVYQAVLGNVYLTRSVQDKDVALKIATYKIEELRALGYSSLPGSGSFSDTLLTSLPSGTASMTITDYNAKVKQVVVTVGWTPQNSTARSVSLTTLVTDTGGL